MPPWLAAMVVLFLPVGGDGCRKGKPSDVTVHSPCGRTPFAVPMVSPLTVPSPCGRAPPFIPRSNRSRTDTFPMWADVPPGLGAGCRQEKRLPHTGGRTLREDGHRPAAGGFPVRVHGNARNAGRGKPCGTP